MLMYAGEIKSTAAASEQVPHASDRLEHTLIII